MALPRPPLVELVGRRWERRLVTVVAGPDGAGGRDVWLSCEPADESAGHLLGALGQACGLPAGADLDAVCNWAWSHAPDPVCFVLDDVHEIPASSAGAALLARLVA